MEDFQDLHNGTTSCIEPKVPSYGGWIKVKNLSIDMWNIETFEYIGNLCGGLCYIAKKSLSFMDMMEVFLKVNQNPFGFLSAKIQLPTSSTKELIIEIDPFFQPGNLVDFITDNHGRQKKSTCQSIQADESSPPKLV